MQLTLGGTNNLASQTKLFGDSIKRHSSNNSASLYELINGIPWDLSYHPLRKAFLSLAKNITHLRHNGASALWI